MLHQTHTHLYTPIHITGSHIAHKHIDSHTTHRSCTHICAHICRGFVLYFTQIGSHTYYSEIFSHNIAWKSESEVVQSCPTLCNPMACSLPGFSVHGIFQARILEWVTISISRRSSQPRDRTCISFIDRWILYLWTTRKAHLESVGAEYLLYEWMQ